MRVRTETLDRFLSAVGEVILSSSQLKTGIARYAHDPEVADGFDRVDRHVGELQRRVLELRTAPLARVLDNLPRTARQVAEKLGKRVEVEIVGAELELDRSILDRLSEPILHLVRNAVDHGLEMPADRLAAGKSEVGKLRIEARRQKDSILIEVSDDGRGIDIDSVRRGAIEAGLLHADLADDLPAEEVVAFVFHPGLSTAQSVSEVNNVQFSQELKEIADSSSDMDTQDENTRLLNFAIRQLNDIESAIIMLHLEETSNEEIAQIIGISQNHVRVKMNRIKTKLKKILNPLSDGD